MIKKIILGLLSITVHLVAIGLIIYLILPIAKWYLEMIPARGVDLYLSASYVSHLLKDFVFRFNGWKEFWFSGVPYSLDYPSFYFYLMIPFAKIYGLIPGIQRFAVFGLFVFAGFSYLLYHQLSQNRPLAIVLTLATVFSANLYRALVWAGGIPFWMTQAFFPMVIFLVVRYCQSENRKWFYLACLAAGLGIMGHPQNFLNLIIPTSLIILFFWRPKEIKFSLKNRFLDVVQFGFLIYLISLPLISAWLPLGNLKTFFSFFRTLIAIPFMEKQKKLDPTTSPLDGPSEIEIWTKTQFNYVWSDTNLLIWYLLVLALALFLVSLILRKKRLKGLFALFPFTLVAIWAVGLVFLYSRGINLYVTGWYKAFWPVVTTVGILTAFLWGEAQSVFFEREFWQKKAVKVFRWIGVVLINLIILAFGFSFLFPNGPTNLINRLEDLDNSSSAFPEILNVKIKQEEWFTLKDKFKPKLMVDEPRDYRLYVIDATVNIWWSTLGEVPLTRGYVDPPIERGGIFWLDAAVGPSGVGPKSSLIEDWKTPEWVADNNAYFLLDWYATKYLEGNHLSASNSNFASNIINDKFIEAEEKLEFEGNVADRYLPTEHWDPIGKQWLNFYRVKKELVSPILQATNAAPILHLGADEGYDILTRLLGEVNFGPRKIVLARGPKFIDEISSADLINFEALILYRYDYHNYDKTWRLIDNYVRRGGKIFIDTGFEVKESDTFKLPSNFPKELPGLFPMAKTTRADLGQTWEAETEESPLTEGVDFQQFSGLIFDQGPWNISYPVAENDLREGAKVILRQKGQPIVMERSFGKGKVIWAGYNLPYHALRDYNPEEAKFLVNIFSSLVNLGGGEVASSAQWISSRERILKVEGGKGVLFKEGAFAGWQASFNGKNLKIYKVGPSDPGFMYVRLPDRASGTVRFVFNGSFASKLYSGISVMLILLILDYILGGKIILALIRRLVSRYHIGVGKWWSKDEDY